jgi:hypothetical protein
LDLGPNLIDTVMPGPMQLSERSVETTEIHGLRFASIIVPAGRIIETPMMVIVGIMPAPVAAIPAMVTVAAIASPWALAGPVASVRVIVAEGFIALPRKAGATPGVEAELGAWRAAFRPVVGDPLPSARAVALLSNGTPREHDQHHHHHQHPAPGVDFHGISPASLPLGAPMDDAIAPGTTEHRSSGGVNPVCAIKTAEGG